MSQSDGQHRASCPFQCRSAGGVCGSWRARSSAHAASRPHRSDHVKHPARPWQASTGSRQAAAAVYLVCL